MLSANIKKEMSEINSLNLQRWESSTKTANKNMVNRRKDIVKIMRRNQQNRKHAKMENIELPHIIQNNQLNSYFK